MTGAPPSSPGIPPPKGDDDDDVAWALQTAAVQWKRGAFADAIVWLRRAVDSAIQAGAPERATELNGHASTLTEQMLSQAVSPPALDEPPAQDSVDELLGSSRPVSTTAVDDLLNDPELMPPSVSNAELGRDSIATSIDVEVEMEDATSVDLRAPLPPVPTPPPRVPPPPPRAPPPPPRVPPPPPARAELPSDIVEMDDEVESLPDHGLAPQSLSGEEVVLIDEVSPPEVDLRGMADVAPTEPPYEPSTERKLEAAASVAPDQAPASERPSADFDFDRPTQVTDSTPDEAANPAPASDRDAPPPPLPEGTTLSGIDLANVRGFEDLPEEAQLALVDSARREVLGPDEEVGGFSVALVVSGSVAIMPAIADATCALANVGDVVFTHGTLAEGVALRVVATEAGAEVFVWQSDALEAATADCPWVADELQLVADRFQALAGATMGVLGERFDDSLRSMITDKCDVKSLLAEDVVIPQGSAVEGMYIVGAGRIELVSVAGDTVEELGPGDFIFPAEVLAASPAPLEARAGSGGALVLVSNRHAAHELMVVVPPLLEILAGG